MVPDGVLHALPSLAPAGSVRAHAQGLRRPAWTAWTRAGSDALSCGLAAGVAVVIFPAAPWAALLMASLAWLTIMAAWGGYDAGTAHRSGAATVRIATRAGSTLGLGCWALTTLTTLPVPSAALLAFTVTVAGSTVVARSSAESAVRRLAGTRRLAVVLAGGPRQVRAVLEELRRDDRHGFDVVAACVPHDEPFEAGPVPVTVGFDHLPALSGRGDAVVVLPHEGLGAAELRRLGWHLQATGRTLFLGTGLLDTTPSRTTVENAAGVHLLRVRTGPRLDASRVLKLAWEPLAAVLALLLLSPLLLGIAVLVRRDSPGPALFRQRRVGRDGRHFTMYKFRTMSVHADRMRADLAPQNDCDGVLFKLRADPRITRVGGVLRRYSLDELPQLLNVVLGQMSLVGPRPALPSEVDRYEHDPLRRLAVRPGLTGLWQVSGRSDLSWDDSVRLDIFYVDNWSLGLDLRIVAQTFRAVLGHRGAY
jgi:exopolysaccharide biosynthesis polyprenyl glycosylphosphotransferase